MDNDAADVPPAEEIVDGIVGAVQCIALRYQLIEFEETAAIHRHLLEDVARRTAHSEEGPLNSFLVPNQHIQANGNQRTVPLACHAGNNDDSRGRWPARRDGFDQGEWI